jgi:hypothetical protein
MDVIKTAREGKYLNRTEKYRNHLTSKNNLHMKDTHIDTKNPAFETILQTAQHTQNETITRIQLTKSSTVSAHQPRDITRKHKNTYFETHSHNSTL